jgi:drug/metabolite transporter (DMT)-like permease
LTPPRDPDPAPNTEAQTADGAAPAQSSVPPAAWLLLAGLTVAWGSMWPLLKIALGDIPLFSLRAGSAVGAAMVLFAVAAASGIALAPKREERGKLVLCALVAVSAWFFLSALGVSLLPAGRAALLAYTMPLWALLIGVIFLNERLTLRRLLGVASGLAAILLFVQDDLAAASGPENPDPAFPALGIIVILGAALAWSVGSTLQKQFDFKTPLSTLVGWQFLIGSVPLAGVAVMTDGIAWVATVSAEALLAALSVTLVSQAFGLWCWYSILKLTDMAFASIAVLSVPLMTQVLSAVLLGETFGPVEAAGLALITLGLATVLPLQGIAGRLRRRRR